MSNLETLIVTFQTQLSDVMEVVVKTAMFEVTRLVEDVFLEEVRRSKQEVESLRLQVRMTEGKFCSDGGNTRRCVDCARIDSDQSSDHVEARPKDLHDDMLRGCDVKNTDDSVEFWMSNSNQEGRISSPDHLAATRSPEGESQVTEEEDLMPELDMKEEEVNNMSCSSLHLRRWSSTLDGEAGCESGNVSEAAEAQAGSAPENSDGLLKSVIKKDLQMSSAFPFPEDQEETHMAADLPSVSSFELDSSWAALPATTSGLLQSHRLGSEKEGDPVKTKGSGKHTEHECSDSVRVDVQFISGRERVSSPEPPRSRLQPSNMLSVTVKEEGIDSGGCKESGRAEKKTKKSGTPSFSCSVQQHRVNSEAQKTNRIYHKSTMQEALELHSNKGTGLRLQTAIQHLHRPPKPPTHTLSSSATAALSIAHSQVVNINNLNRNSSTSKTVAAPAQSVQRVHLSDKQMSALNRSGASWVGVKSHQQPTNSHNANPAPQPGSHPYPGARHLLRCNQCGKCFPHPSNLKAHLQTHTGERPFCCSLCSRSFTKLSNLKAHRRVHTGERPYCCLACGKRFTQKCNLKRHQRIHLDM